VGLSSSQLLSGVLDVPVSLAESDWQAEVQLAASQTMGLEPEHISFDFQASGLTDGLVARLHWVACELAVVSQLNQCVRDVGWQLFSIEPALEAAQRAAQALRGGLDSVLTQPVQDWQFEAGSSAGPDFAKLGLAGEDWVSDALLSMAGPRLIASGLALRGLY
jgi:Tfp pilus assembly PilM family ATPase